MTFPRLLIITVFLKVIRSHDSDSIEVNRLEATPYYDTIIISDIADIINEFENNMNFPQEAFLSSASESSEDVEDLLSEYQHYLEKAQKQRKTYLEKSKSKNKVPLLRHEKYSKGKAASGAKYDNLYNNHYYNPNGQRNSEITYSSPLDLFIPFNPNLRAYNKPELTTAKVKELPTFEKLIFDEETLANVPFPVQKSESHKINSSCYCKNNQFPCSCGCKQCLISFETEKIAIPNIDKLSFYKNPSLVEKIARNSDSVDNTFNVRVKVDIQLPKILTKYKNNDYNNIFQQKDVESSKESISSVNLPLPYFNFPIPMDLFGYKKTSKFNKHESAPIRKITIHKKKKSKFSNNNKKHRKKVITIHNIKLEPQQPLKNELIEKYNISDKIQETNNEAFNISTQQNDKDLHKTPTNFTDVVKDKQLNETGPEERFYLMVNITNTNTDNGTENSIETDFTKAVVNVTEKSLASRRKRAILPLTTLSTIKDVNNLTIKNNSYSQTVDVKNATSKFSNMKKPDRILADTELLYWPIPNNQSIIPSKNITTLILEREIKKPKLNMSKETIRLNHTVALEQAIFGQVDWNDVGSVAPAFISFVGKYIRGVLTFCSPLICHSMKCADKACIHRTCSPKERFNQRGHCTGSNNTDSIASMESIMDLPSNIVFEVVDILENKVLGNLFGKMTLCISSKCITFMASKKLFFKSKCSVKELTTAGHCPNSNNELYLNPWKNINKAVPKIINFKLNGDISQEILPAKTIVNLKKIEEDAGSKVNLDNSVDGNDLSTSNFTYKSELIRSFIDDMERKPQKKIKILTNCNELLTTCRFLACPNVKEYCTLCEVTVKGNNKNITTCEAFSTKFLVTQGHKR